MLSRLFFLFFAFFFCGSAFAQDSVTPTTVDLEVRGRFAVLDQGETTPFGGVLFDIDATSHLLTLPDYYSRKYSLDCDYLLSQGIAKKDLEIEKLNIRLTTQAKQLDTVTQQKDLEISALQVALKKKHVIKPWMWGIIGGVVGSGVTVGVVRATQ